jgi:hypothetical protein
MSFWRRPPPLPPILPDFSALLEVTNIASDLVADLGETIAEMSVLIEEIANERDTPKG